MMRKRLISICTILILVFSIYRYSQITEYTFAPGKQDHTETDNEKGTDTENTEPTLAEDKNVEIENASAADATEQEEQAEGIERRRWQVYIQPDTPEPFMEVLKQYEEFMNTDTQILYDDAWWSEFNVVDGERGYLYVELCGSLMETLRIFGEKDAEETFRYSLTDLTGDGFPELIMGCYIDIDFFDEPPYTYLYIIYYYSETEGIKMEHMSSYYTMKLYEGGIIECISAGAYGSRTYRQFQKEIESWEKAACIIEDRGSQSDSEKYYWGVNLADFSDPDNKPMSEKEYQEIIEKYASNPVELEWTPLFYGEPVTVVSKVAHYYDDESNNYWAEYEYDNAGNQTKANFYNSSDGMFRWDECEYDNAGNRTRVSGYYGDGSFYYRVEDEYDSAGNLTKETTYDADGSIHFWHEYKYDNAGNRTRSTGYEDDGSNTGWIEWGYDSTGNMTKEIQYGADGSIYGWWHEYEYDSAGNMMKEDHYNNDGSIHYWYEYEYDGAGNMMKRSHHNADGIIDNYTDWECEYEYDNTGKKTRFMSYDADGSIIDWYEYEYDAEGNMMEEINCSNNGSTYFRTEYEYDSAGNLEKETEYYLSHRIEHEYITNTPLYSILD